MGGLPGRYGSETGRIRNLTRGAAFGECGGLYGNLRWHGLFSKWISSEPQGLASMPQPRVLFSILLLGLSIAGCGKGPESYTHGVPDESAAHAPPAAATSVTPPSSGTSNGTGEAVPVPPKT